MINHYTVHPSIPGGKLPWWSVLRRENKNGLHIIWIRLGETFAEQQARKIRDSH